MNRGQFFKGIAALVGLQATGTIKLTAPKSDAKCYVQSSTEDVFVPCGGALDGPREGQILHCGWIDSPDKLLKEGEERSPLGHVQRPKYLAFRQELLDKPQPDVHHDPTKGEVMNDLNVFICADCSSSFQGWDEKYVNLSICSTCGIVYMSTKETK